eukprot:TRINITY_DN41991_c0_g1_i1.p1 TRINITY_DN41991_c0_g1~~TRINITY_DN41991_c0_g1_i1.p1  ORF type:complete len:236 (+),score=59.72 TRINITY_DN41991_c0_g1_i1:52-708(+)
MAGFYSEDSVGQALQKFAAKFKEDGKEDLAKMTNHVLAKLADPDARDEGVQTLIQLQDQLHTCRRMGSYVHEANVVETITGRMRADETYGLENDYPKPQAERSEDFNEMLAAMQKADLESRPYEFLNQADSEEITVNIKVPEATKMQDVTVNWTATKIRVSVKGHELQPIIDGSFFKPVEVDGCDFHLEGSGSSRKLVLDVLKQVNGMKWPDLLAYGA